MSPKDTDADDLSGNPPAFSKGQEVIWTDPDGGRRARYTVVEAPEDDSDDGIYSLSNSAGSECEAYPHELEAAPAARVKHATRKR